MPESFLLVVFLRGGADGLALCPPLADPWIHRARPSLAAELDRVRELDRSVGLHPELEPLRDLSTSGDLSIHVGVGSDDQTRSHFEAQAKMEWGARGATGAASGWLARHLSTREGPRVGPLSAAAFGALVPESLRGVSATALTRIEELAPPRPSPSELDALERMYLAEVDNRAELARPLSDAGMDAVRVARAIRAVTLADRKRTELYPDGELGRQFAEAALLAKHAPELGVEVATIDQQGWDTHFVQEETLPGIARELARSIAGLAEDLGDAWQRTTLVALTEFGRRVGENVSRGTDHGRASIAIVAGGGLGTAPVVGAWPALDDASLEGPGDVPVTSDYRALLRQLLASRLHNARAEEVFPEPG